MNKITGCGIDIEELNRFSKYIPSQSDVPEFMHLVYSDEEISVNREIMPHLTFPLAFSCKEAFFKAFGVSWTNSPISWKDVEIFFENPANLGQYSIRMSGHALKLYNEMNCSGFETSLDHTDDFVIFQVLLFSD